METATITKTLNETIDGVESTLADTFDSVTSTISERFDTLTDDIAGRLDEAEQKLPTLPRKVIAYNRAISQRAIAQSRRNNEMVLDAVRPVLQVADTGVRTVVGTTRWAVGRTVDTATSGLRQTVGQAKAQFGRTASTLSEEATGLVEEATDQVVAETKAAERRALMSMTKAELYEMAQDLDIEGRADMTKAELVSAINNA